jgi:hypothetical protein
MSGRGEGITNYGKEENYNFILPSVDFESMVLCTAPSGCKQTPQFLQLCLLLMLIFLLP